MKVLITTTDATARAVVDPRFGRAEWFAVYDTETERLDVVPNPAARDAVQGAGIQAAELAARLGVRVVITGHCGPKAFTALSAAGISVMTGAEGTVAESLEAFRQGRLVLASGADVRGHWR